MGSRKYKYICLNGEVGPGFYLLALSTVMAHIQTRGAIIKGKTDGGTPFLVLQWEEQYGILKVADTIQVNQGQSFGHQIKLKEPTSGILMIGDNEYKVWLEPGSLLTVNLKEGQPALGWCWCFCQLLSGGSAVI